MRLISVISLMALSSLMMSTPSEATNTNNIYGQSDISPQNGSNGLSLYTGGFVTQWWTKCSNTYNLPQRDCPFNEGNHVRCVQSKKVYKVQNGKRCELSSNAITLYKPQIMAYDDRIIGSCYDGPKIDTHKWETSGWSDCGCDGYQTRKVICTNLGTCNAPHEPQWCLPTINSWCGTQPTDKQKCTPDMKKCNQHRWRVSEWSQCSTTCGKGTQTRHVVCTDKPQWNSPGAYDDNLWCQSSMNSYAGPRPADNQECYSGKECVTYRWYTQTSQCSATCGKGTQTITAVCKDSNDQIVDNTKCSSLPKPAFGQRECESGKICNSYTWYRTEGQCSITCGNGVKQVTVTCKDQNDKIVDNSLCPRLTKPSSTPIPCSTGKECCSYKWEPAKTECSATCGQGTRTNYYTCKDCNGIKVDDSKCAHLPCSKLSNQIETCQTTVPCKTYSWYTTTSNCSASCGKGTKTTKSVCKDNTGAIVDDSKCASQQKPADKVESCDCGVSCHSYHWVKNGGQCSVTCGKGTITSTYSCHDENNKIVADSLCSGIKPAPEVEKCNAEVACESFKWFTQLSNCSATCGQGTKTTTAICKNNKGEIVDNNKCDQSTKPSLPVLPCEASVDCITYSWVKQKSQCSATCGSGTISITYVCQDSANEMVSNDKCSHLSKPADETLPCSVGGSCPTYHWVTKQGECSASCGKGTKTTSSQCRNEKNEIVDDTKCDSQTKPAPETTECHAEIECKSYHWFTQDGKCSVTCGQGTITSTVVCKDESDAVVNDSLCDDQTKPIVAPSTCTKPKCSSVVGDPQFVGLKGQEFQVHGVDGQVYNLISDIHTQVNSKFVFLSNGKCPIVNGEKQSEGCWTHRGSYLGEIGIKTSTGLQYYLKAGSADTGFEIIKINNSELKVGQELNGCKFVNSHRVEIETENYTFIFENSDNFINQKVSVKDSQKLEQDGCHGLLGQTIHGKVYNDNTIKYIAGDVSHYIVNNNEIFGDDYAFNLFN